MKEYELHISDKNQYSKDLNILRKERNNFLMKEEIKITLIWNDKTEIEELSANDLYPRSGDQQRADGSEDEQKSLSIFAVGPNLWVDAFESSGNSRLSFEEEEHRQNYQAGDNPGMIDIQTMTEALSSFMRSSGEIHEWKTMSAFRPAEKNSLFTTMLRNTYLICIYLASEAVRNEFFELIHSNYSGIISWKTCKVLFQNWKSISRQLHPDRTASDIIPVVRWEDWKPKIDTMPAEVKNTCEIIKKKLLNSR